MNIVIVGHVDHGKSTIIGRMLADTGSLPEGKLEQVKRNCELNSKPFEYAFLLDALKHEQSQGITIDSARVFFSTQKRSYIIIDAPGHIEFLKNMVSGAARAEAAFLVIDAEEGIQENSRRHGYMLSMLGVKQVSVLVNKMDLVDYDRQVFKRIVRKYSRFLNSIDIEDADYIPVSGMEGATISALSEKMAWYEGETVVERLDRFEKEKPKGDLPFRMPVQDVYKFTRFGDRRRIYAGTVATGTLEVGDEVIFFPSGKHSTVLTIEGFNTGPKTTVEAPWATGFTLEEQIYITRGEIAVKKNELQPRIASRIRVSLFWLSKTPMTFKKQYCFKIGTTKVPASIEEIVRIIDASDLKAHSKKEQIEQHDVAECVLKLGKAIAFDLVEDIAETSRFVIVDDYEIRGGGIVRENLPDQQEWARQNVMLRNYNWEVGNIAPLKRAERYNQRAALILITGLEDNGKKEVAKRLEEVLFHEGKLVYYLGIGNMLYGVSADIKEELGGRIEQVRRLGELAHIFLDAGMILVITAVELAQADLSLINLSINTDKIETVWVGDDITTDITADLHIQSGVSPDEAVERIKEMLKDRRIIFRPF
jgi:bifunctional enzyme CysN/CysC